MGKQKEQVPEVRKPQEINILNIILLVVVVALNLALAYWCYYTRVNAASRVDGLMLGGIILLFHYPICLACDIYAGLHIRDSFYLPLVSPLIFFIIDPLSAYGGDDPMLFLGNIVFHMAVMLAVAGSKKLSTAAQEKRKKQS